MPTTYFWSSWSRWATATDPSTEPATISTELIPFADYGGGAKYSLSEHSVDCAEWLRSTWSSIVTDVQQPAVPAVGGQ